MDKNKLNKLVYLFFSFGIGTLAYILVHETGHLIVMLLAGAEIDDFSILTAHVSSHGGSFTEVSEMWMNANGAVLPIVLAMTVMLFYDRSRQGSFYRIFFFILTLIPIASLLAWVIIPFVYLRGSAPANDDVTKFLNIWTRHFPPLYVSAAALVIIAAALFISIKKGVISGYIAEVKALKKGVEKE